MTSIRISNADALHANYAKLNKIRLKTPKKCDVDIVLKDGSVHPCHECVLSDSFEYFRAAFDEAQQSRPLQQEIHVPVCDGQVMRALLDLAYTGQTTEISDANAYDILSACTSLEYKHLISLCEVVFAQPFLTSRLFDIFDLFHRVHFKSPMWYATLRYIARRFKKLSLREEYLSIPFDKIRPRCTGLFRYLPAFLDNRKDALLDYIIRWANYNREERKLLAPRLLEKIYIRDVPGPFAKSLVARLVDVEDFGSGEHDDKCLRTFARIEKKSQYFNFEFQWRRSGSWQYVNCEVGESVTSSRFVAVDGRLYNLRSVYEASDGKRIRKYYFQSTTVDNYENLAKDDGYGVRKLNLPSILEASGSQSFDIATTSAGIYVYSSTEPQSKCLHKQICLYNRQRDEWHQPRWYVGPDKPLTKACLISRENSIYLIGGRKCGSIKQNACSRGHFFTLDERENTFRKLPSMKIGRTSPAACIHDDRIYVAGGQDNEEKIENTCEVFDLKAGKWHTVTSMKFRRQNFKLVPFDDKLWAIGSTYSVVETYDPRANVWSTCKQSLVDALEDPAVIEMLRPEPPQKRHQFRVLDALVF